MSNELIICNEILINASAANVWDVLVNPEQTKKYMFGCETVSNWNVGDELLWRGDYEGVPMVFVKGFIQQIIPAELLVYTVIDPNNPAIPDVPENYLTVKYFLKEQNGTTILTVMQEGFETVAEGKKRYADSYNNGEGWNPVLVHIKSIAENN